MARILREEPPMRDMIQNQPAVEWISILMGAWLLLSAFIWPHNVDARINSAICGALVAVFAALSPRYPVLRFVNTLLSVWIFVAAFALPHSNGWSVWNNAIVALIVFLTSFVPRGTEGRFGRRRATV